MGDPEHVSYTAEGTWSNENTNDYCLLERLYHNPEYFRGSETRKSLLLANVRGIDRYIPRSPEGQVVDAQTRYHAGSLHSTIAIPRAPENQTGTMGGGTYCDDLLHYYYELADRAPAEYLQFVLLVLFVSVPETQEMFAALGNGLRLLQAKVILRAYFQRLFRMTPHQSNVVSLIREFVRGSEALIFGGGAATAAMALYPLVGESFIEREILPPNQEEIVPGLTLTETEIFANVANAKNPLLAPAAAAPGPLRRGKIWARFDPRPVPTKAPRRTIVDILVDPWTILPERTIDEYAGFLKQYFDSCYMQKGGKEQDRENKKMEKQLLKTIK